MVDYEVPNAEISQQKYLWVCSGVHVQGLWYVQAMWDLLSMSSRLEVWPHSKKSVAWVYQTYCAVELFCTCT